MQWVEDYRRKLTTAEEAVKLVGSGNQVYYGGNGGHTNRFD